MTVPAGTHYRAPTGADVREEGPTVQPTVLAVDSDRDQVVARAAEVLRGGGVVVLPTDTVYGLAADAFCGDATTALRAAQEVDADTPLTVFVRSPKQLLGLTPQLPQTAERLVAAYWPGPLTIVVPAEPGLRWHLGRTRGTVAVRMPLDDTALAVVRAVGPLAVTSAQRPGRPLPVDIDDVVAVLGDGVALYLDDGPREGVRERSTIVDLTGTAPRVLRPGAIDELSVLAVARGEVDPLQAATALEAGRPVVATDADHDPASPGSEDG